MKKVTAFLSDDGRQLFETAEEAEAYEAQIRFGKWYESHKLYGNVVGSSVELEDLSDWLCKNSARVREFLDGLGTGGKKG